jgi:hypothetical protein
MEQGPDEQVTVDFAAFDDAVADPVGEPMGVVVTSGYQPVPRSPEPAHQEAPSPPDPAADPPESPASPE